MMLLAGISPFHAPLKRLGSPQMRLQSPRARRSDAIILPLAQLAKTGLARATAWSEPVFRLFG
jgi:hypothetical protein